MNFQPKSHHKILSNFHTHSHFSDGSSAPVEYIEEAIRQGFTSLGFSEHSVLPFENTFALKPGRETAYIDEINQLREDYKDRLQVYLALEVDFIPGMSTGFAALKQNLKLDYTIGSVHLVGNSYPDNLWFIDGPKREIYDKGLETFYKGDFKKAVTNYWHQINQMLEEEEFDVVGHLDKIKMHNQERWFSENDKWYQDLVNETIDLVEEKNVMVEVNTRGIYKGRSVSLFPGEYILEQLGNRRIPVILSSDAHQPHELSMWFYEAKEIMKQCEIKEIYTHENGNWISKGL
ncbi:MAG: histidinol-phosphatase [Lentimicrobium sp.]|nr:histidinol-phosphatase [Lentimicrobium sp.]